MPNLAQPGTIIHGTLRTDDLITAFAIELQGLSIADRTDAEARLLEAANKVDPNSEESHDILNDLFDALDARAPEGHYFGAHEGDSSDFGFWPYEEE